MTADINSDMLASLREAIRPYLKDKRYLHTLAVEKEAAALGEIFLPDEIMRLRAAALLHDITKKSDVEKQLKLCREFGIMVGDTDVKAPKLFHARTAAALIPRDFPEYADDRIISGVRWHTTGHAGMTMFETIIYLADYIEQTRTFDDCVVLRRFFYKGLETCTDDAARTEMLRQTMILSFDMTIKCLISDGSLIDRDTVEARNSFLAASL